MDKRDERFMFRSSTPKVLYEGGSPLVRIIEEVCELLIATGLNRSDIAGTDPSIIINVLA